MTELDRPPVRAPRATSRLPGSIVGERGQVLLIYLFSVLPIFAMFVIYATVDRAVVQTEGLRAQADRAALAAAGMRAKQLNGLALIGATVTARLAVDALHRALPGVWCDVRARAQAACEGGGGGGDGCDFASRVSRFANTQAALPVWRCEDDAPLRMTIEPDSLLEYLVDPISARDWDDPDEDCRALAGENAYICLRQELNRILDEEGFGGVSYLVSATLRDAHDEELVLARPEEAVANVSRVALGLFDEHYMKRWPDIFLVDDRALLCQLYDCNRPGLRDASALATLYRVAITAAGAEVVGEQDPEVVAHVLAGQRRPETIARQALTVFLHMHSSDPVAREFLGALGDLPVDLPTRRLAARRVAVSRAEVTAHTAPNHPSWTARGRILGPPGHSPSLEDDHTLLFGDCGPSPGSDFDPFCRVGPALREGDGLSPLVH